MYSKLTHLRLLKKAVQQVVTTSATAFLGGSRRAPGMTK
jgi:hypothetical protein